MAKRKVKSEEERFKDFLKEEFPSETGIIIANGLQNAFVGLLPIDEDTYAAVYSIESIIELLITRDGMTAEQAMEFFETNILSYKTSKGFTPIFIHSVSKSRWV